MMKFIDDLYTAYSNHCERNHITTMDFTVFQERLKLTGLHISIDSKSRLNFDNQTLHRWPPPPPESEFNRFLRCACTITGSQADIIAKVELHRAYLHFCTSRPSTQLLDFVSFCGTIQAKPGIIPDPDSKFKLRGHLAFAGIRLI